MDGVHVVRQIEFLRWPDYGVCTIEDLSVVFDTYQLYERLVGDAKKYIHCSAGVGRTGVYCVCHCVMRLLLHGEQYVGDLIVKTMLDMRKQRPGLIQTYKQFEFCYLFLQHQFGKISE